MIDNIRYVSKTHRNNNKYVGVGVRKDNYRYVVLPEKRNVLNYSSPCVCGSFTHTSTRHRDCVLNKKYVDM